MATLRVLLAATLCAYAVGSLERMTPVLSLNKRHLVEGLSTDVFGNPVDTSSRLQIGGDDSPASMATLRLHGGSPQVMMACRGCSLADRCMEARHHLPCLLSLSACCGGVRVHAPPSASLILPLSSAAGENLSLSRKHVHDVE